MWNITVDQYSETDPPVAYSVLVDMPRDIAYDEMTRYNCERDKYLELLVNHKTIVEVQSAAVGRSNECTDMLLQASLKIVQQTKAPY
jgi:hypothetical protein